MRRSVANRFDTHRADGRKRQRLATVATPSQEDFDDVERTTDGAK